MTTNGIGMGGHASLGDGGDGASDPDEDDQRLVDGESRHGTHQQGPNR